MNKLLQINEKLNSATENYLATCKQLDQMYFCLKKVALFNKLRNYFMREKINIEFSISILFIGYVSAYENFSKNILVTLIDEDFFDLNNEEYRNVLISNIPNKISEKNPLTSKEDFKKHVIDKIVGLTWNNSSKNMNILADLVGKELNIDLYDELNIDKIKLENVSKKIISIRNDYVHHGGENIGNISFKDLEDMKSILMFIATEQYLYLSNNAWKKMGF